MKKEDARQWLLNAISIAGGPSNSTNKTVLKGGVFAMVKELAYLNFKDDISKKKRMTFGNFLRIVRRRIAKMDQYKAVILPKGGV